MGETILYALAEWSVRAAVLAGAVGALLWAARIKDAHLKLNAWTIVLIAALLMPLAATVTPQLSISVPRFIEPERSPRPQPQPAFTLPLMRRDFPAAQPEARPGWPAVASGVWLLIALGMLFRLMLGIRLSSQLVHGSAMIEGGLRESDLVRVPITVGVIQPQVILPSDWREWPERKLRAVIAHERAHVSRRDPLRQLGASIYRSVAWFHPLAWWLRAQIAELAEEASDDAAIAAGEDRVKYAEALLSFIKRTPQRVEWEGVTMANRQTRMRRIERVLDQNRKLSGPLNGRVLAGLVLAALPLVYLSTAARPVWAQAPAAAPQPQQTASVCGGDQAYAKWLDQDVAYIITSEERQAFVRLADAPECAQFVEQFWLRRDPTPGTPENEFKAEHYRRIGVANQRFGAAQVPGWRTDRGRVYITYGPPDEIESHQQAGDQGRPDPFEQWLYHHAGAVGDDILFDFADTNRDKSFRLVFMGAPTEAKGVQGPMVFGPVSELYVQVNNDRTLFITTPVRGVSVPVYGTIVDVRGSQVDKFEDVTHTAMYGRGVSDPLAPGEYTLHLRIGNDNRSIPFQVK